MTLARSLALAVALTATVAHGGVLSTMTGTTATPDAERKYDGIMLKPADLKSCLVDAYSIDIADALFDAERPKVEEERAELHRLREAARGKPTNAGAASEAELRLKAQAFNARIAALNSRVAYAQDARDRFSRVCKGRKYFFEDLASVRRQLPREIRDIVPR
jgi:hypothetical protein